MDILDRAGEEFAGHQCQVCDHEVEARDMVAVDRDERGDLVWHGWCHLKLLQAREQGKHDGLMEAWRDCRAHHSKATVMDVILAKAHRHFRLAFPGQRSAA